MPRKRKNKEFKRMPEHLCKVCSYPVPKPQVYCSSECRRKDNE